MAILGLIGCQELGPTAAPAPREALAVTTLALPGDSTAWTSFATDARGAYSGVELGDGSVLVCGGSISTSPSFVVTCNRLSFDGALHSQTFPLPEARTAATLSLLPDNRVLLAGGKDATAKALTARVSLPLAGWADNQNIWGMPEGNSASPSPRAGHTATLLDSSIVLIGGDAGVKQVSSIDVRSDQGDWSKFDPSGLPGALATIATRNAHSATLLKSQPGSAARVLILGGYSQTQGGYLSSGFIFSLPNAITPIAPMPEARMAHTATLLDDGSVLVVGGEGASEAYLGTALRYYPDQNSWASAGSTFPRKHHAAVRLGSDVVIAGGISNGWPTAGEGFLGGSEDAPTNPKTVQRYNPVSNAWASASNLRQGRRDFQLFALDQTHLLAVGGANPRGTLATSEVFTASALGQPSSDPYSCVSGQIADGVCCNVACDGPCRWCNDPAAPGTCRLVSGETPNQNGCESHLQCSAGMCPARCDAGNPCQAGFFCRSDGKCQEANQIGAACNANSECADGAPCVDGVCCQSACSGSCEACNQPFRAGLCLPLAKGA
ncbi:MAG TPA: kelch repeat-containing protein, partial [Polyangiaceae bacterium]|nr:kelch repeat-containing protein [Polyangiaceae bacterium]